MTKRNPKRNRTTACNKLHTWGTRKTNSPGESGEEAGIPKPELRGREGEVAIISTFEMIPESAAHFEKEEEGTVDAETIPRARKQI